MAQFRATLFAGQRTTTSKLGHKTYGVDAKVCGWESGITVYARHVDGQDVFSVYTNGGSNDNSLGALLVSLVNGRIAHPKTNPVACNKVGE